MHKLANFQSQILCDFLVFLLRHVERVLDALPGSVLAWYVHHLECNLQLPTVWH
jgi:hypothetical protein